MASSHDRALDLGKQLFTLGKERQKQLQEEGSLLGALLNRQKDLKSIATAINEEGVIRNGISERYLKIIADSVENQEELSDAIGDAFPGLVRLSKGAAQFSKTLQVLVAANPMLALFAAGMALGKVLLGVQKAITDTRKELGVSAITAAKITAQNKVLGQVVKAYGLDVEDIKSAQASIRQDLGASAQEAVNLSVSFARTAAATGQSSQDLAKTLSIMESMSGASREVLLNQIRNNAAMIEAAGVAPSLVMQDIASNSEFFAQFAKEGGQNLIQAATAARKLGLDMSAVASVTESLLDFESSIEASMEASMLLGRNINTDRARQLALIGDQKGLMEEVRRIAGGEAEFEAMNQLQRMALAKAVGTSVEQLSRLVRNNTATATTATAAPAGGDGVFNELAAQTPFLQTIAKSTKEMAAG